MTDCEFSQSGALFTLSKLEPISFYPAPLASNSSSANFRQPFRSLIIGSDWRKITTYLNSSANRYYCYSAFSLPRFKTLKPFLIANRFIVVYPVHNGGDHAVQAMSPVPVGCQDVPISIFVLLLLLHLSLTMRACHLHIPCLLLGECVPTSPIN